jgi:hypothetical protein
LDIVKYFIEDCLVDVNATTNDGATGLDAARQGGHEDVARYLAAQIGKKDALKDLTNVEKEKRKRQRPY